MKIALGMFVLVPLAFITFGEAMHLMSQPSDAAVFAGYLMLVVPLLAAAGFVIRYMIRREWWRGKNPLLGLIIAVGVLSSTGCYKIVEPGHVGILVQQTGSQRGVQDFPAQSGRVFYNPFNEDVLEWPINVQRVIWSSDTNEGHKVNEEIAFQSKEGLRFAADVNAAYQMQRDKVPHFYVQFRTEDMDGFTHGFFRDAVRNAFKRSTDYTAEEINGSRQSELISKVQDEVKAKMIAYGIDVIQIGFAAPPRPPDQVRDAIHNKIAAIQKSEQSEFEKRSAIAEGEKVKALADAYAEANRVTQASITPQLIEWEKIKKWDGKNPQVVGSNASTFVTVK